MPESDLPNRETLPGRRSERIRVLRKNVRSILEMNYKLDINTTEKLLEAHFAEDFLPPWYFFSTTPEDIANHIMITSQLLDANHEYLQQISSDGREISYFVNVGRDFPGRLAKIIRENKTTGIQSYDSVKTKSGIRIITIEIPGRAEISLRQEERDGIERIKERSLVFGRLKKYNYTRDFLSCLPLNYYYEEFTTFVLFRRILRHLHIYEHVRSSPLLVIRIEDVVGSVRAEKLIQTEKRIIVGVRNPGKDFIITILNIFHEHGINLNRSYYDTFSHPDVAEDVGICSLYVHQETDLSAVIRHLSHLRPVSEKGVYSAKDLLDKQLETIVRGISAPDAGTEEIETHLSALKKLIAVNTDLKDDDEMGSFLLNAFSDFLEAASRIGIDENSEVLRGLLGFDAFDEFIVPSTIGREISNRPGFRIKHNSARGPCKGGLRIDSIVEFVEVLALAFMMTWKCARSRILFGGGKGGMMLNPKDFDYNRIDFFDTLTNFGRSLFPTTGPAKDVPAGDVGCGPEEIGNLFEGFKSALRDLALMVYGSKRHTGLIGNNKIISTEQARTILAENFAIDIEDDAVVKELTTNENYLELVCAAQITGKPRMGIQARTGATGRGLCYAVLVAAANKYLDGTWKASEPLEAAQEEILRDITGITEQTIVEKGGNDLISHDRWRLLDTEIFPRLLGDKKVVVQGSGKVGGSMLKELCRYGVNLIAVADAGGAVIGDHLDVHELLEMVEESRTHPDRSLRSTVVGASTNVHQTLMGPAEGTAVLELECDILVTAALENAITAQNARRIKAAVIACGSNGSNTSKAEKILGNRGITVLYDFLANQAGVTASYFEWLHNLAERYRYEAEKIHREPFDINIMNIAIMPEFKDRIKRILCEPETGETTREWNMLLRDIMFAAVNEDYKTAHSDAVSMKTAGFTNALLRVLSAQLLKMPDDRRTTCWKGLNTTTKGMLKPFLSHPETELINSRAAQIRNELYR